ncbi:Hypothetical protein PEIBARAKI_4448 [Petrimonas sp. IBARAKI]|nr:Hypothetical protein PEIBARAKI_4448 [Petrimonas sp. IBARAKI]
MISEEVPDSTADSFNAPPLKNMLIRLKLFAPKTIKKEKREIPISKMVCTEFSFLDNENFSKKRI